MARKSAAETKEQEETQLHPRLMEHLVGHDAVEKQLLELITAKRFPHAILLTGPRGIGKATLAWRLARFLLTPQESGGGLFGDALPPESLHVAASHPIFRRMAASAHPDFLALETADIKVEEARSVAAFLALTPAEGDWRVVIIDSADAMNRNAANALLKTLEEPPARAVIILVSHNPGALLPTIRSRCRTLRVPPLGEAAFVRIMATAAPELTPQQAQAFALLSGGSPGVALTLAHARADTLYQELLERMASPDTLKAHAFADRFARKENEEGFRTVCRLFLTLLNRMIAQGEGLEVFPGEHALLARLREGKSTEAWLDLWERSGKLFADARYIHLDKKQVLITILRAVVE
jgi:DNA polymerase-3 subunit delta'